MNAKYIYSQPVYKVMANVYVNANGDIIGVTKCTDSKSVSLPRYTVCSILDNETRTLYFGLARCSSKDRFDKKIGRQLSTERAINSPVAIIKVPDGAKISEVTFSVAQDIINRYESNR